MDLMRNEHKKNTDVSMTKMKAEHERRLETMRNKLETELKMEMQDMISGSNDNLGEMEATQRQLAEDLNVARLAESREVKQVNALTQALSVCREIERKQRAHALEESNALKQLRESKVNSTTTLRQELEAERCKVKKLEEDLVRGVRARSARISIVSLSHIIARISLQS
jgi:hypothetical protein